MRRPTIARGFELPALTLVIVGAVIVAPRHVAATPLADGIDEALAFRGRTVAAQGGAAPKGLRRALAELARLASSLHP